MSCHVRQCIQWIVVGAVILVISPVFSDETSDKDGLVHKLPSMTIKGEKEKYIPFSSDVNVSEYNTPVTQTPLDVLESEPGIDLTRTSLYTPNSKMVKLRGFTTEKTLVTLDGRPVNGAGVRGGYQVDWSMLQLQDVEKIEIIRGGLSAEYGNTLGGVIDIIPRVPAQRLSARLNAGMAEYDTQKAEVFLSKRSSGAEGSGGIGFSLGAGMLRSDGFLRNAFARRADVSPSVYLFFPDQGHVTFSMKYSDGEFGMPVENIPGTSGYDPDFPESTGDRLVGPGFKMKKGMTYGNNSMYWKSRRELDLELQKKFGTVDVEAGLYHNFEDRTDTFYDMDTEALFLKRRCPSDTSWGWFLKAGSQIGSHRIKGGVEGNNLGYEGTTYLVADPAFLTRMPSDSDDQHDIVRMKSVFVQDRWSVMPSLELYLGLRLDNFNGSSSTVRDELDATTLSPKAGLFYYPNEHSEVFVSFARAVKFPIIPKFYWYYGGYQPEKDGINRKDLTYDDALQYEIGGSYDFSRVSLSARAYHYYVKDYLRWIFGYKPSRVVYNLDEVRFTGIELSADASILPNLNGFLNYTWERVRKKGDILDKSDMSDRLGEIPEHKFNVGLRYTFMKEGMVRLTGRWVDEREIPLSAASKSDTATMDSFFVMDLMARGPVWKKNLFVYAGVDNLFDKDYEETYGFPMPGRMFFGGIELKY